MYVWFLLPTYPNFFNPTLNIKMVFGEKKYLKWARFQILSLFSLLNVVTKFNNFPTYLPYILLVCNRNHTYVSFRPYQIAIKRKFLNFISDLVKKNIQLYRGQKYFNIALFCRTSDFLFLLFLQNTCTSTCLLKAYAMEHKGVLCNITSSSNSFQSTCPVGRVLLEELLVLSRFHL